MRSNYLTSAVCDLRHRHQQPMLLSSSIGAATTTDDGDDDDDYDHGSKGYISSIIITHKHAYIQRHGVDEACAVCGRWYSGTDTGSHPFARCISSRSAEMRGCVLRFVCMRVCVEWNNLSVWVSQCDDETDNDLKRARTLFAQRA